MTAKIMNALLRFSLSLKFIFTAAVFTSIGPLFAADEFGLPDKNSPEVQWWRDSRTNLDARLAWFRDARFGMFIHWGVYSVTRNTFSAF
jgi:hypothetical protein